jgi:hypothetical protein
MDEINPQIDKYNFIELTDKEAEEVLDFLLLTYHWSSELNMMEKKEKYLRWAEKCEKFFFVKETHGTFMKMVLPWTWKRIPRRMPLREWFNSDKVPNRVKKHLMKEFL